MKRVFIVALLAQHFFVCANTVQIGWHQIGNSIDLSASASFDMAFSGDGNRVAVVGNDSASNGGEARVFNYFPPELPFNASISDGGSISVSNGLYDAGSTLYLVATADPGYLFTGWSGDVIGDYTTATTNFILAAETSIIATFSLDADGDGLTNNQELSYGSDPREIDTDNDNINDYDEVYVHNTDLLKPDSDDDGLSDSVEVAVQYELVHGSWTVDLAANEATARGGYLARITSLIEWNQIKSLILPVDPTKARFYLIDGADSSAEGSWSLTSGEPFVYENWASGEPNNTSEFYTNATDANYCAIRTDLSNELAWVDFPSGSAEYTAGGFILERDQATSTDPNNPDTDGDGLSDGYEINVVNTNPNNPDSDEDGLSDYDEAFQYSLHYSTSWADAVSYAEEIDAELAMIKTMEELVAVSNYLSNIDLSNIGNSYLWIGGYSLNGQWYWSDDSAIDLNALPSVHNLTEGMSDNLRLTLLASNITEQNFEFLRFQSDGEQSRTALLSLNVSNPVNADSDQDGLLDGYEVNTSLTDPNDSDSDDDGLTDGYEVNTSSTNPNSSDGDNDGLSDGYELSTSSTDPNNSDSDSDGLSDGYEVNTSATDPNNSDSDDDGLTDGYEVNTSSTNPNSTDSDNDGLSDDYEINTSFTDPNSTDSDEDGLNDGFEVYTSSTDPNNADTDGDSIDDGVEFSIPTSSYLFDPTINSSTQMQELREMLDSLPSLMNEEIASYRMGDVSVQVEGSEVFIQITIEESTNGVNWHSTTNILDVVQPASGDAGFYSLEFE